MCVCIFISFGRRMKEHLGCYIELECRLSYMNFIVTMTFPFNFIAHRYFDVHLIVGTDNLRGKEQSIWSIYVNGVVRCGACGSVCYLALLALLVMFYALHNLIVLWFCVAIQIAAWVWVWYVNLSVDWLLLQFKLIFCVRRPMSVKLLFWSYTVFGGGQEKQIKIKKKW